MFPETVKKSARVASLITSIMLGGWLIVNGQSEIGAGVITSAFSSLGS